MSFLALRSRRFERLVVLVVFVCAGCQEPVRGDVPAATLVAGNQFQVGLIGSYCWYWGTWFYGIHECVESIATGTPATPLVIRPADPLQVKLPEDEGPADVTLCWIHAQRGGWEERGETWLRWGQPLEDCAQLSKVEVAELAGPQRPGYHALTVFADWGGQKDAVYGFLIEVPPSAGSQ